VNLVRSILREKEGSTVKQWEDWSSIFISRKDSTSSKNEQEKACIYIWVAQIEERMIESKKVVVKNKNQILLVQFWNMLWLAEI
jgi:hypothetical protein